MATESPVRTAIEGMMHLDDGTCFAVLLHRLLRV